MILKHCVQETENYTTVKDVLKNYFQVSDRFLVKLKHGKNFFLNNENVYPDYPVKPGDVVSIQIIEPLDDNTNLVATPMNLSILYEDDAFLILNKPAGVTVHPSQSHYDTSLSNGVRFYYNAKQFYQKVRIVNRLDKDTSGIVIFAKNAYFQEYLSKQMHNHTFLKQYLGITEGIWEKKSGTISLPIDREEGSIIKRCIDENGAPATTHYQVLKEKNNLSLLEFTLETGKTHQIRVHTSYSRSSYSSRYFIWEFLKLDRKASFT